MSFNNSSKIKKYITGSTQFGDLGYTTLSDQQRYDDSQVVILGIPYDGTATYLKGSKLGPESILSASKNLEMYDETFGNIHEVGIYTAGLVDFGDIETIPVEVHKRIHSVSECFVNDNKFLVSMGGEHSITCGVVKAYKEKYENLSVLQLDAHLDLFENYSGSKYNHACAMRRIIDDYGCKVTHTGIRVMSEEEELYIKENNLDASIFRARHIYNNRDWFDWAIDSLSDTVYITLDVDVFDPSLMPATGTPVPGGLDWYLVLDFLMEVFKNKTVVGMDVAELKPNHGNEAPNFIAADLIYKNIGFYKEYVLKTE